MAYIEYTTDCCGICEAIGMNDTKWSPEEFLKSLMINDFMDNRDSPRRKPRTMFERKHVLFSAAFRRDGTRVSRRPKELKKYVEENGLGTVVLTEKKRNTSGNWVIAGIWSADKAAVLKFMDEKFDGEEEKEYAGYDPDGCNCIDCRRERIRGW